MRKTYLFFGLLLSLMLTTNILAGEVEIRPNNQQYKQQPHNNFFNDPFFNLNSPFWQDFRDYSRDLRQKFHSFRENNNYFSTRSWQRYDAKNKLYIIEISLNNLEKDDIDISLHDNSIVVKTEANIQKETKSKNSYQRSYSSNSFYQSFSLPKDADSENIKAEYEDNVLTISIPRDEKLNKSKKIKIL